MDTKTRIYYDFMIPPTYIRLISERLALDHIVYTDATTDPSDIPKCANLQTPVSLTRSWSVHEALEYLIILYMCGTPVKTIYHLTILVM